MPLLSAPSSAPTQRGKKTRSDLEEAAKRLIAERGYLRVTVADIAAAAGRSTAAFYRHFESKEHLLAALSEGFAHAVFTRAPVSIEHTGLDDDFFLTATRAYWESFRENLGILIGVAQQSQLDPAFAARWGEIRTAGTEIIERTVRMAQQSGHGEDLDPRATSLAIGAMFEQHCFQPLGPNQRAEHLVDDEKSIRSLAQIWRRTLLATKE